MSDAQTTQDTQDTQDNQAMDAAMDSQDKKDLKRIVDNFSKSSKYQLINNISIELVDSYERLFESKVSCMLNFLVPRILSDIHEGLSNSGIKIERKVLASFVARNRKPGDAAQDEQNGQDEQSGEATQSGQQDDAAQGDNNLPDLVKQLKDRRRPKKAPKEKIPRLAPNSYPILCCLIKANGVECGNGSCDHDGKLRNGESAKVIYDADNVGHFVCSDCFRVYNAVKNRETLFPASRFQEIRVATV